MSTASELSVQSPFDIAPIHVVIMVILVQSQDATKWSTVSGCRIQYALKFPNVSNSNVSVVDM